jgi:hypothetical protein
MLLLRAGAWSCPNYLFMIYVWRHHKYEPAHTSTEYFHFQRRPPISTNSKYQGEIHAICYLVCGLEQAGYSLISSILRNSIFSKWISDLMFAAWLFFLSNPEYCIFSLKSRFPNSLREAHSELRISRGMWCCPLFFSPRKSHQFSANTLWFMTLNLKSSSSTPSAS